MIVSISHNDILLEAQTEAMRRVELSLAGPQLAELTAYLHGAHLVGAGDHGAVPLLGRIVRHGVQRLG